MWDKVFVYRNLKLKTYSIRSCKTRRVIDRKPHLVLKDVKFKVSEAGRQRVIKEKRKNVHAGAVGFIVPFIQGLNVKLIGKVTYNPYTGDSFIIKENGSKIWETDYLVLNESGVFAYGKQHN